MLRVCIAYTRMVWLPDGENNSNICLFVLTWSTNVKKSPFLRIAAHIFVFPGDAPATIMQYVAWMERQFNACQTPRSMYLSIFSSFRYFYHIFVSPGDAPGAIMLSVVSMEREFIASKLSRSMYPSIFNSFPVIRTASAKNHRFYVPQPNFFVFCGDAPATITQYVALMEKQFNACQTPRSMYLSIFSSFRVIRCLSQCVSLKIAIIYHISVSPGTPLGQSR